MFEEFPYQCKSCGWAGTGWDIVNLNDSAYVCPRCHSSSLYIVGLNIDVAELTKPRTPKELMGWVNDLQSREKHNGGI